jgi:hypothetical protein
LLIGHISRNPQWAKLKDVSHDPRVAANAVESIWGLNAAAAKEVFREASAAEHSRRAINGAIGLYLAREIEAVGLLFRFARHPDPDFRASAAWGMGRTGDLRFLKTVETLAGDSAAVVKSSALHALAVLHQRLDSLRHTPEIPIHIRLATFEKGEHVLQIGLREQARYMQFDALHFAIFNGATPVEEYAFTALQSKDAVLLEVRFRGPQSASRLVKVDLFTDRGCGECAAFESSPEPRKSVSEIVQDTR